MFGNSSSLSKGHNENKSAYKRRTLREIVESWREREMKRERGREGEEGREGEGEVREKGR